MPATADLVALGILALLSTIGWCAANGAWSFAALAQPTAYLDPEKADVIHALTMMKVAARGEWVPLAWKQAAELGAPVGANWNDWPMVEELQVWVFGLLARVFGLFAGLNLAMIIGHVLAAWVFYAVARTLDTARVWAFSAALAFGLCPFIFAQSPYHITCAWVWQVPSFLLVWHWLANEAVIETFSKRFWQCVAIGFMAGLLNPYFTNILCQLALLIAGVRAWRNRSPRALIPALAVVVAAAVAFFAMNVDTWTYRMAHGPNPGALVREYKWLEIYGLKIKDLFIPPLTHHAAGLANFAKAHRQVAPLLDEGASYQGIIGIACLLWLVAVAVRALVNGRQNDVPMQAWQVLWIVLTFTTGGFNSMLGVLGVTMFRGGCRYSVVILAITLAWAARRLSTSPPWGVVAHGPADGWRRLVAAVVACLVIFWDQVPRTPTTDERRVIARQVESDRDFAARMEGALPAAAMVFQLPVIEFPESPAPGVPPYDHFRPYLYSEQLRYSFGSMKGRPREKWQAGLQSKLFEGASIDQQSQRIRLVPANAKAAVDELVRLGFAAIYLNRAGFPDRGRGIEEALFDLGYTTPPIRNSSGDLACIVLSRDGNPPREPSP